MNLDGKRIVITGASSGIGQALLQQLAQRRVQIVAAGRDQGRLWNAVDSVSTPQAEIRCFTCDLAAQGGVDHLFEFAIEQIDGIDLFFANAGFAYWERATEPDWTRIDGIFRTNVFSPIYAAQKMHALSQDGDYRVAITSSILGRVGLEGYALYSSTKAALDRFAEVFRLETGARRSLVLVYPLAIRSRFFETAGQAPIPWLSQTGEAAARAMLRGIEQDRETIYTSWILPLVLLVHHLLPFTRRWYQAIDSRVARRHWAAQERTPDLGEPRHG
jgi:short-subunit dehydrogenase